MPEIVYLLTNPCMPDLVKIGMTSDLNERLLSLSSHTGVPVPFECFYACEVKDARQVERSVHDAFGDHRINPKREFFRINPERIVSILKLLELKNITPSDEVVADQTERDALEREQARRSNFRFSFVGIHPGAILSFVKDETITAKVVDDRSIEFEGEVTSTSKAARDVLHRLGGTLTAAQGPLYWVYEGETLSERRSRMENE